MPIYTVTCNGSLITKSGRIVKGGEVEMTEAEFRSLPVGTVAPKTKPVAPPVVVPVVAPVTPPPVLPVLPPPAVEASRGRKGNKS